MADIHQLKVSLVLVLKFLCSDLSAEFNQRLYVKDDNVWSVRGRFRTAVQDKELVKWEASEGKLILSLCVVSLFPSISKVVPHFTPTG